VISSPVPKFKFIFLIDRMTRPLQFYKTISAIRLFLNKCEVIFSSESAMKSITFAAVQDMTPCVFQEILRSKHIIVSDYNLPSITCDRRGLTSLNSVKEVVNMEGMAIFTVY
jgi:hypothetical protein